MALEVLCAGICTIDQIATVSTFPQPDGRMDVQDFTQAVGGIAAVAAAALARLSAHAAFAGRVGDDPAGRAIRAALEADGVDTSLLATSVEMATPETVIISDTSAGTRSILNHPGIATFSLPASASDAIARVATQAAYVHFDHTAFPALADVVLPRCKEAGVRVSLDAGVDFPGIERFVPLIDVYVTTDRQLAAMTGERDLAVALARVRDMGPHIVAATLGAQGSAGLADDGSLVFAPAFSVPVVDTTGAGDVFHGAFLYTLLQGWDMERALTFANAAAGLSCRAIGGHPGCPTLAEVQELLAAKR